MVEGKVAGGFLSGILEHPRQGQRLFRSFTTETVLGAARLVAEHEDRAPAVHHGRYPADDVRAVFTVRGAEKERVRASFTGQLDEALRRLRGTEP